MTFSVELSALDTLADETQGLADLTGFGAECAATTASSYVSEHTKLGWIPAASVYSHVAGLTEGVRESALATFERMGTTLTAAAAEVRATAVRYEGMDQAGRSALDAAYPEEAGVAETSLPPAASVVSPDIPLKVIPKADAEDWFAFIFDTNWLSPVDIVSTVIGLIFPWNPLEEVAKRFTGDWAYVDVAGGAFSQLAEYCRASGDATAQIAGNAMEDWTGEAADAAAAWFAQWVQIGESLGQEFDSLALAYDNMARGMADLADVLAGLFAQIMDAILYSLLLLAATALSLETVIGGIVFGILTFLEVSRVPSLIVEAYQMIQKADDYRNILSGAVALVQSALTPEAITAIIPATYDNPQVPA